MDLHRCARCDRGLFDVGGYRQNFGMRSSEDAYAARRVELLQPVARLCREAGLTVYIGELLTSSDAPVKALLCSAADGTWDAAVTVVRARRNTGHQWSVQEFTRDPRSGYDLGSPGEMVYEVQIVEDGDGATDPGGRHLALFNLLAGARAAADELILWTGRPSLFHAAPPVPDQVREQRRHRLDLNHRTAAAARPAVHVVGVPGGAEADVDALDHAALCWHFPRDRTGRYQRSAVVALAAYGPTRPHRRGEWLAVRADGDRLAVMSQDLIGVNQRHRWDVTPWLWDRRHASTPPVRRWQVDDAEAARPVLDALRRGAVPDALRAAGVDVDDQVGRLLAGEPTRLFRAALTDVWVARLYAGLADSAPWRFTEAYRSWAAQRRGQKLPVRGPVNLFGLGGLNQQRRPQVALDLAGETPVLRLVFSGSNAVLPRSLWTVPADLSAALERPGTAGAGTPRRAGRR